MARRTGEVQLLVSFPDDLHHAFKVECTTRRRSMSGTVKELVARWVAEAAAGVTAAPRKKRARKAAA